MVERFNFSAALTADGRRRIVKLRASETEHKLPSMVESEQRVGTHKYLMESLLA